MRRLLLEVMEGVRDVPELCVRVREARERAGLTQERVAQKLEVSLKTYSAYERFREPSPRRQRQIATVLGLPVDYFQTAQPPPTPEEPPWLAEARADVREFVRRYTKRQEKIEELLKQLLQEMRERPPEKPPSHPSEPSTPTQSK